MKPLVFKNVDVKITETPDGGMVLEIMAGQRDIRLWIFEAEYEEIIRRRIIMMDKLKEEKKSELKKIEEPNDGDKYKVPRRVRIVKINDVILSYYPKSNYYGFATVGKPGKPQPVKKAVVITYIRDATKMLRLGNPENAKVSVYVDEIKANLGLIDVDVTDYIKELIDAWESYIRKRLGKGD